MAILCSNDDFPLVCFAKKSAARSDIVFGGLLIDVANRVSVGRKSTAVSWREATGLCVVYLTVISLPADWPQAHIYQA